MAALAALASAHAAAQTTTAPAAASAAVPTPEPAVATTALPSGAQDRTLGGHVFIQEILVRTPFAATNVQANILYGVGTAKGPALVIRGEPIGEGTYEFASLAQIVSYEHKVAEGIALGLGMTSQLYTGIDGRSFVVLGTEVGAGIFGTSTFGMRLGPIQGAFTLDVAYGPRYGLLVLDAIDKAITPPYLDNAGEAAFKESYGWTLKPGLSAAWAPIRSLGFTASAGYQWASADSTAGTTAGSAVDLAAVADYDFGAETKVPVGLLAAWRLTAPLGSNGSISRVIDYSFGVFYTGRPALVLGLEAGWRNFGYKQLDTDQQVVQLRVQYFW